MAFCAAYPAGLPAPSGLTALPRARGAVAPAHIRFKSPEDQCGNNFLRFPLQRTDMETRDPIEIHSAPRPRAECLPRLRAGAFDAAVMGA